MRIFISQNKIKVMKRNCGKEQTAEECIGDFEGFLDKVRFYFIQLTDYDDADGREPLWGRFPL